MDIGDKIWALDRANIKLREDNQELRSLLRNLAVYAAHIKKRAGVRMDDPNTGALPDAEDYLGLRLPKDG